jgi:hypothetical protein
MSTIADLRPGMIGFGPLNGRPAKLLVDAGQLLLGEGFKVGPLTIEHVFVVTEAFVEAQPTAHTIAQAFDVPIDLVVSRGPWCVEAMPSGARQYPIGDRWTPEYAYVQLPEDYPGQAEDAAAIARAMIGTPYSFASYAALAAWKFGLKAERLETWIDRRREPEPTFTTPACATGYKDRIMAALPREAICSVLADQSWALTGKQVMPQGTPHQCVTPGALAAALLEMPGTEWLWPGK